MNEPDMPPTSSVLAALLLTAASLSDDAIAAASSRGVGVDVGEGGCMVSIPLTGDLDMRLAAARVLLQVASLAVCDDGTAELHWNHINLDLSPVEIMQALRDLDRGTPPVSALVAFDVGEQEVAGGAREIRVETRGVAVFAGKEIRLRASSCDRRSCLRAATEVAERILQGLPVHLPGSHAARAGGDLRARLIPSDEGNWIEVTL